MNASPDNGLGHLWQTRRGTRRASTASIIYKDVQLDCEVFWSGVFLAATDIDCAESPTCEVKSVSVNGADVTRLLASQLDEIACAIERQLVRV